MAISLQELADLVGGRVRGDGARPIDGVRGLASAGPRDLSFLTHPAYRAAARTSGAGALLVREEDPALPHDLLVVETPGWAVARLLAHFHPAAAPEPGVHPTAVVAPGAEIAPTARVEALAVVGEGSRVGEGAHLHSGVVVGRDCRIGDGSVLYPRVVLYDHTELGDGVVVHAGAVLGADGFGYAVHRGALVKVPQVGRVVIEDGVEIGANTTIDRATLEETRIGAGAKLDNLVQVGHNVRLGGGSLVCGQVGIAGSAVIGRGVVLGGNAGVGDHVEVGDGVQLAARGTILQSVGAGKKLAGTPAVELGAWRRRVTLLNRLAELFRRVRALERRLGSEGDGVER